MVGRRGHSLPELIVAVTFLGTTVAAVGGTAVLGGRWTGRAVARQEAVRLAAQVLDSLATAPGVGAGQADAGRLVVRWRADAGALRVEVTAGQDGPTLAVLVGRPVPDAPALPDAGGERTADTEGGSIAAGTP